MGDEFALLRYSLNYAVTIKVMFIVEPKVGLNRAFDQSESQSARQTVATRVVDCKATIAIRDALAIIRHNIESCTTASATG